MCRISPDVQILLQNLNAAALLEQTVERLI